MTMGALNTLKDRVWSKQALISTFSFPNNECKFKNKKKKKKKSIPCKSSSHCNAESCVLGASWLAIFQKSPTPVRFGSRMGGGV